MLMTDTDAILDDILARHHAWARAFRVVGEAGASPMFRQAKSPRGWDTADQLLEDEIESKIMKAVDFHIGELPDDQLQGRPYRSAIYCLARNCYTGRNVWMSPRLPADPMERGVVVREARNMLTRRLIAAGVM